MEPSPGDSARNRLKGVVVRAEDTRIHMSIFPLPQFESDVEAYRKDMEEYERLSVPDTMVVRFGVMRMIGEFKYSGDAKPGCGSKMVARTHRGTEIAEMLTSTCPNAGCSKSVTRKEMLEYIENSGGKDYPFHQNGRVLRVATIEDMNRQAALDAQKLEMRKGAQRIADELGLEMRVIDAEPILGGERLTFYFTAEERVDFREMVRRLASEHSTRIEMRQVGARDEARVTADYERCGQHCCCRQFLKVLKPVSIRSAKQQKATLDPLKISGRCGRLMCCLRYEDQSYAELAKRLPKMKKRVGTPDGIGRVVDRQILTQLVLVQLEETGNRVAVPVEEVVAPEDVEKVRRKAPDPLRGMDAGDAGSRAGGGGGAQRQDRYRERSEQEGEEGRGAKKRRRRGGRRGRGGRDQGRDQDGGRDRDRDGDRGGGSTEDRGAPPGGAKKKSRRRRRGRGRSGGQGGQDARGGGSGPSGEGGGPGGPPGGQSGSGGGKKKRRRRRRGRGRGGGSGDGSGGSGDPGGGGSGDGGG